MYWQAHECRELELQAWNVIIENFDTVADNSEFLDMSAENLLEIIKYDDIQVQTYCISYNLISVLTVTHSLFETILIEN